MTRHHTCPLCSEEAIAERCIRFQFDWELPENAYADIDLLAPTTPAATACGWTPAPEE